MSSALRHETGQTLAVIADQINTDFNAVAEMLPFEAKTGGAGIMVPLRTLEGIGAISTMFLGRDQVRDRFMVRLIMQAEGYGNDFGFYKDYELTDYNRSRGGSPYETEPVMPSDLYWCPGPVEKLASSIHSLREDFLRLQSMD